MTQKLWKGYISTCAACDFHSVSLWSTLGSLVSTDSHLDHDKKKHSFSHYYFLIANCLKSKASWSEANGNSVTSVARQSEPGCKPWHQWVLNATTRLPSVKPNVKLCVFSSIRSHESGFPVRLLLRWWWFTLLLWASQRVGSTLCVQLQAAGSIIWTCVFLKLFALECWLCVCQRRAWLSPEPSVPLTPTNSGRASERGCVRQALFVLQIRDFTSFACVNNRRWAFDWATVSCFFKHPLRLIHTFIPNDPVLCKTLRQWPIYCRELNEESDERIRMGRCRRCCSWQRGGNVGMTWQVFLCRGVFVWGDCFWRYHSVFLRWHSCLFLPNWPQGKEGKDALTHRMHRWDFCSPLPAVLSIGTFSVPHQQVDQNQASRRPAGSHGGWRDCWEDNQTTGRTERRASSTINSWLRCPSIQESSLRP